MTDISWWDIKTSCNAHKTHRYGTVAISLIIVPGLTSRFKSNDALYRVSSRVTTMGFLQKLFRLKKEIKQANITILGPSKAGKTTLIQFLETGQPQKEEPLSTLGVDFRREPVKFDKWKISLIDVGGQQIYQNAFWNFTVEQSDAVIYVIDSLIRPENNEKVFEQHLVQFNYVLDIVPDDVLLMILLNKQDLVGQNPITPENIAKYYPFVNIIGRTVSFMPTSAKFGNGVADAFNWLIEQMNR